MEYQIVEQGEKRIVECLPEGGIVTSEPDALDLVAICGENETDRLLLHESNLSDDFFQLKTGLLGTVLLKLGNYFIRTAAVISPERSSQGRFGEFVLETNRRREFRVFADAQAAKDWLFSLE